MPRKYYSAKQVLDAARYTDKLKALEETIRRMEREQGTSRSDEAKTRKQTKRWKAERKEAPEKAQKRYEKKVSEITEQRVESEPKAESPAYEKELRKVQKIAKKKLLMAKIKREYQARVKPQGSYASKLAERAAFGSLQKSFATKQPTYQYTKNIRPPKGLLKLAQRLGPTPQLPRGRPDWIYNRPPITGALGATNVFMNHPQTSIIKGRDKKSGGDNIFWR